MTGQWLLNIFLVNNRKQNIGKTKSSTKHQYGKQLTIINKRKKERKERKKERRERKKGRKEERKKQRGKEKEKQ